MSRFPCSYCERSFESQRGVDTHARSAHPVEVASAQATRQENQRAQIRHDEIISSASDNHFSDNESVNTVSEARVEHIEARQADLEARHAAHINALELKHANEMKAANERIDELFMIMGDMTMNSETESSGRNESVLFYYCCLFFL